MVRYSGSYRGRGGAYASKATRFELLRLEQRLRSEVLVGAKQGESVDVVWLGNIGSDDRSGSGHDYRHTAFVVQLANADDNVIAGVVVAPVTKQEQIQGSGDEIVRLLKHAVATRHSDEDYATAIASHGFHNAGGIGLSLNLDPRTGAVTAWHVNPDVDGVGVLRE